MDRGESCGGWIRTNGLQVMSLASYHCSTPRLVEPPPVGWELRQRRAALTSHSTPEVKPHMERAS
jgi:hypothetical protein